MELCWNCESCLICETEPCDCKKVSVDKDDCEIKFGKFKGKTFKYMLENEPSYLEWVISSIPKNKIDNDLYDYIYVNRNIITSKLKSRRRKF